MASPVFDHVHLAMATAGNPGLLHDVLDTFVASCRHQIVELGHSDTSGWLDGVHRLKGAARSVGAIAMADAAAAAESDVLDAEVRRYWTDRFAHELARFERVVMAPLPAATTSA